VVNDREWAEFLSHDGGAALAAEERGLAQRRVHTEQASNGTLSRVQTMVVRARAQRREWHPINAVVVEKTSSRL